MAGPMGAQPFHQAPGWHFNKDKSVPKSGMMEQMGGMVDDGVKKVGAFFDKSRSRQMVFAWIVLPAITLIAARMILGQDFFTHGIAGLKNPGVQVFMGLPVLGVIGGLTLYTIVMVTTDRAPEKMKKLLNRVMKLALLSLYMVGLIWVANQAFQMQGGLVRTQYTHPASTNFLQNLKNGPTQVQAGGLFCTSWPGILLVGSFAIPYFFEMFVAEFNELCKVRTYSAHERSQTRQERRRHLQMIERQRLEMQRLNAEQA